MKSNFLKKILRFLYTLPQESGPFSIFLSKILPSSIKKNLTPIRSKWKYINIRLRTRKDITRILGTLYKPNHRRIEIDVTYACNLKCYRCNRLCNHSLLADHPPEHITLEQVRKFIDESILHERHWEWIHIAGGEPSLHPNILDICNLLVSYRDKHSPQTRIIFLTNGVGHAAAEAISLLPRQVEVLNSNKTPHHRIEHSKFTYAPCDLKYNNNVDFSNGCPIPSACGIGLTPFGYYHCNPAGAFDRIMGFDVGRKKLPDVNDAMVEYFQTFCKYCGAFGWLNLNTKDEISQSWRQFFVKYEEAPPILSRY